MKKDTTQHTIETNFVIRPKGKIWENLCETFKLSATKNFSAVSVFNELSDPNSAWHHHYGFACYRPDDSWRGPPVRRFEIQPELDIGEFPHFKYLSFSQAKLLVEFFTVHNLPVPEFLRIPDFYLPSKNIKFIMENKNHILEDDHQLELFTQTIGVSREEVLSYIKMKKDKLLVSEKNLRLRRTLKIQFWEHCQ